MRPPAHRNEIVAALAEGVWFAHITPGGQSERLTHCLTNWRLPISMLAQSCQRRGKLSARNTHDQFHNVIVCDLWMAGFDAPCLHAMYADKPTRLQSDATGRFIRQKVARAGNQWRRQRSTVRSIWSTFTACCSLLNFCGLALNCLRRCSVLNR